MTMQLKLLKKLKSTHDVPVPGDIFVMQRKDTKKYLYGLVVSNSIRLKIPSGEFSSFNLLLVYFYKYETDNIFPIPKLEPSDLILSPEIQGHQGWIAGYYMTVEHIDLNKISLLPEHKFWRAYGKKGDGSSEYLDEFGTKVGYGKREKLSMYGMGTHYIVDLRLRKALGLAPLDALE